jgi:hypothetical protein
VPPVEVPMATDAFGGLRHGADVAGNGIGGEFRLHGVAARPAAAARRRMLAWAAAAPR